MVGLITDPVDLIAVSKMKVSDLNLSYPFVKFHVLTNSNALEIRLSKS